MRHAGQLLRHRHAKCNRHQVHNVVGGDVMSCDVNHLLSMAACYHAKGQVVGKVVLCLRNDGRRCCSWNWRYVATDGDHAAGENDADFCLVCDWIIQRNVVVPAFCSREMIVKTPLYKQACKCRQLQSQKEPYVWERQYNCSYNSQFVGQASICHHCYQ